jgi:hypothetical protein
LHVLLLLIVSVREAFWLIAQKLTVASTPLQSVARVGESATSAMLGRTLAPSHPIRHGINTYLNLAGIESGYGFFAPNVPDSYRLVFEIHYPNGEVDYEAAATGTHESRLRFASLLDFAGSTSSEAARELLIKILAHSIWQDHPDAIRIRGILGSIALPSPGAFRAGEPAEYQFLVAYDFALTAAEPDPKVTGQ